MTINVNPDEEGASVVEGAPESVTLPQTGLADASVEVNQPEGNLRRFLLDIVETVVLSLVLFWVVNLVSARIRVEGFSMEPTFRDGELVIVNKLAYKFSAPQRGDVIVFYYPRDPKEEFIKRIIGLPGDRVDVREGKVYVNSVAQDEPYIAAQPTYEYHQVVPEGTLFVLGDNRNNSSDSHSWGPLPMELVIGKALFVYWPPPYVGAVEHAPVLAQ